MKKLTFTLWCTLLLLVLGNQSSFATNPISQEASVVIGNDFTAHSAVDGIAKKQTIFGKFFKQIKTKAQALGNQIKEAYYAVARTAKGWLWLWLVLGLAGFLVGLIAVSVGGGLGNFLSIASYAAYVASAVCFVLWIVALAG